MNNGVTATEITFNLSNVYVVLQSGGRLYQVFNSEEKAEELVKEMNAREDEDFYFTWVKQKVW